MPYMGATFTEAVTPGVRKLAETVIRLRTPTAINRESLKPPELPPQPPPEVYQPPAVMPAKPTDYVPPMTWPPPPAQTTEPEIVEAGVVPGPQQLFELLKNPWVLAGLAALLVLPALMSTKGR